MAVSNVELDKMSVDELNDLIKKAREIKTKKATPSIKINGYVASVGKHVNAALEAIKKLQQSEGVSDKKWDDVKQLLSRLQLDKFQDEAAKVKLTPRAPRGGRRKR